jgi:hypothetical protein
MSENYFSELNNINVSGKTEKKNGLTYLSWAWAWGELKKLHPDAVYTIYEDSQGRFYHTDGKTAWVKTGVTVNGIEHIEYLPVMDFKNKSIPVDNITSVDVNKAVQRSLTKAVARHGLGLYIYAGEDLPEEERVEEKAAKVSLISAKEVAVLKNMCERKGVSANSYKGKKLDKLTGEEYAEAMRQLGEMPDKEIA